MSSSSTSPSESLDSSNQVAMKKKKKSPKQEVKSSPQVGPPSAPLRKAPLPEPGYSKPVPEQPLVGKSVDLGSPPVNHSISEEHHAHVLLISSDSPKSGNDSPIPATPESPSSVPLEHGGNHTIPPPSSLVASFYWNHLTDFHLPSNVPFQITVRACAKAVPGTILDEGACVSLMSSITRQALGSPYLGPVTQNLLAFDRGACPSLGVLPKFPITLGGKTIYIDVLVTQGALDFSLLLGHEYVYAMGALVSSLFHVVFFPHNRRIVIIYQLSFFSPPVPPTQFSSPPDFYPPIVSAPP
ncbi:Hypothetical predicted protein [Olea europaea subsp. europaea]|uniref:Uncharacterized protein n=1 Tax=Olea europaea subsp. europaea TaxID=158383 RepID=A0A8S0VH20_OLEEU|nr:Hypothetical predicted protein [Olea europaea subsp. europaea]